MTRNEVRAGFPADAASAAGARRFVDATLRDWNCDNLVDVASLLVSELVSNAVLHAGTAIQIVVRVTPERLRVEVHDGNPRLPTRKHYSALSTTGRGLMLVERLSQGWGTAPTPSGKVVWFELDLDAKNPPDLFALFDLEELDADLEEPAHAAGTASGDRGEEAAGRGRRPSLELIGGTRR